MDKEFSYYVKTAKEADAAKKGGGMVARRKMYTVDKDGNKVVTEDKTVQLQPATADEAFGTKKPQKKMETMPISSETKINNADQTKDWMSVGSLLDKNK